MEELENTQEFLLDGMLGKLARWLRILGFDTLYAPDLDDASLVKLARREERILVTKDRNLYRQALLNNVPSYLIRAVKLSDMLASMEAELRIRLSPEQVEPRCSVCNVRVVHIDWDEAQRRVPKGVSETYREFWRCSRCQRIYWKGTHWRNMNRLLDSVKGASR